MDELFITAKEAKNLVNKYNNKSAYQMVYEGIKRAAEQGQNDFCFQETYSCYFPKDRREVKADFESLGFNVSYIPFTDTYDNTKYYYYTFRW